MKKKISLILVVILILQVVTPVVGEITIIPKSYAAIYGDWEYELVGDKVKIIKYTGTDSIVQIPNTINGHPVTTLGQEVFIDDNDNITKINIPCNIESIEIAIYEQDLITRGDPFSGCGNLTSIEVASDNRNFVSEDGVLFDKAKKKLIRYPRRKGGDDYAIPPEVKQIGDCAFASTTLLKQISIPRSVVEIGDCAFMMSAITTVSWPSDQNTELGDALECSLGACAFFGCESLPGTLELPAYVTSIGEGAFASCGALTEVIVPDGVTEILSSTFLQCSELAEITLSDRVKKIKDGAFWSCEKLNSIALSNCLIELDGNVFTNCPALTIYTNSEFVKQYAQNHSISYVWDVNAPKIERVSCVQHGGTSSSVTIQVIGAEDEGTNGNEPVGLPTRPYSFDGGLTWQAEDSHTYDRIENGTVIKVKDKLGNVYEQRSELEGIKITNPPIKTEYVEGEDFDTEGMEVRLHYNDDSISEAISERPDTGGTGYVVNNGKNLRTGTDTVWISYTEDPDGQSTTFIAGQEITVGPDTIPPVIDSVERTPDIPTNRSVNLTVRATDRGSKLADLEYSFDGGSNWQSGNRKIYTENKSGIKVWVRDKAGNVTEYPYEINIDNIDKIKPTILNVSISPELGEGEWTNGDRVVIITAYDEGCRSCGQSIQL